MTVPPLSPGSGITDFRPVSNLELQFAVLGNGSLSIAPAARHHEGQYMCRAENGIGRGLSKIINVSVNGKNIFFAKIVCLTLYSVVLSSYDLK